VIFLDIDGVLRPPHGGEVDKKGKKTLLIDGQRVALRGDDETAAGDDFWPVAVRALRSIVVRVKGVRIVLSSDWRKEDELKAGVARVLAKNQMSLYGATPVVDEKKGKMLGSPAERRVKEIRKWLKDHPEITSYISVDDMELSGESEALLPEEVMVKCEPAIGLTPELASDAVSILQRQQKASKEREERVARRSKNWS